MLSADAESRTSLPPTRCVGMEEFIDAVCLGSWMLVGPPCFIGTDACVYSSMTESTTDSYVFLFSWALGKWYTCNICKQHGLLIVPHNAGSLEDESLWMQRGVFLHLLAWFCLLQKFCYVGILVWLGLLGLGCFKAGFLHVASHSDPPASTSWVPWLKVCVTAAATATITLLFVSFYALEILGGRERPWNEATELYWKYC